MDAHLKKIAEAVLESKKSNRPPHSECEKNTTQSQ